MAGVLTAASVPKSSSAGSVYTQGPAGQEASEEVCELSCLGTLTSVQELLSTTARRPRHKQCCILGHHHMHVQG